MKGDEEIELHLDRQLVQWVEANQPIRGLVPFDIPRRRTIRNLATAYRMLRSALRNHTCGKRCLVCEALIHTERIIMGETE